ncbi:MAG: ribonuclease H-like domain-containing protein [Lachnospiraceae bacterium]
MITVTKQVQLPDTYPLERIGGLSQLLFFDIETTGFSGDYASLYLIGCTYHTEGSWQLIQWFADTPDSEPEILHSFFKFLENFSILVHFNGDGFDIPFLLKRCHHLGLSYDFSRVTSFDIYKRIKPFKKLLGLTSLKQKSIEHFLGIQRDDLYSGGQLIQVYHDYLVTREDSLYRLLMLHNEDDLKGMPSILPILYYPDFLEGDFTLEDQTLQGQTDIFGTIHPALLLTCKSDSCLPVPLETEKGPAALFAEDNRLYLTLSLYQGQLKYFYPDYQNYYYLKYEDTAIHKSVADYVDKSAKTKATAKTCYCRRQGCFLPQTEPLWEPALRENLKDKISYTEYSETLLQESSVLLAYLRQWLQYLKN